jgi:hypothetical protein
MNEMMKLNKEELLQLHLVTERDLQRILSHINIEEGARETVEVSVFINNMNTVTMCPHSFKLRKEE